MSLLAVGEVDATQGADQNVGYGSEPQTHWLARIVWASLSGLGLLERGDLASVNRMPSCTTLASSALRRCLIEVRSCRRQMQRTPAGEIDRPCRFSISDTRTWP
jgi:hypothetical protein